MIGKKICVFAILVVTPVLSIAACWTGKGQGIIQYTNEGLAIDMDSSNIHSPNPAESNWTCKGNWIWLNIPANSDALSDVIINQGVQNRMLSIANAAIKTGTELRMCFSEDAANKCIATQVYDLGNGSL